MESGDFVIKSGLICIFKDQLLDCSSYCIAIEYGKCNNFLEGERNMWIKINECIERVILELTATLSANHWRSTSL